MLVFIGLIMVLSASSIVSYKSSDSSYTIFLRQAQFALVGAVAMTGLGLSTATWKRLAVPPCWAPWRSSSLVFTPLGKSVNGTNWIAVGPISIQPSEFAKLGLVLFGAAVLTRKRKRWASSSTRSCPMSSLRQPGHRTRLLGHDLGTVIVMGAIVAPCSSAGVSWRLFAVRASLRAHGRGHGPHEREPPRPLRRVARQGHQPLRRGAAAAPRPLRPRRRGWWGVGLGASREKWQWLSEPHNDFIYAIIGEELGLPGTLVVLALFAVLALVCYRLVLRTDDLFIRLATGGIMAWIVVQADRQHRRRHRPAARHRRPAAPGLLRRFLS